MSKARLKPKLRKPVAEYVRSLHPGIKKKIKAAIGILLEHPESGKALRDELAGYHTYRSGRFRIIYIIRKKTLDIFNIGPRKTIYEETYRLLKKKR